MHWYKRNGETAYDAGIKEARENRYFPSVTEILYQESNYGLEQYKINEAVQCALTLPRDNEESDKDFIKRVREDGKQHAKRASKIGNIIHKLISRYMADKPLFFKGQLKEIWDIFEPLKNWVDEHIDLAVCEFPVYNNVIGSAGTCDIRGDFKDTSPYCKIVKNHDGSTSYLRSFRGDFKTQGVKHNGFKIKKPTEMKKPKINYYESWCGQLVAYEALDNIETDMRINIVIGTIEGMYGVWVKEWKPEEEERQLKKFFILRDLFYLNKRL